MKKIYKLLIITIVVSLVSCKSTYYSKDNLALTAIASQTKKTLKSIKKRAIKEEKSKYNIEDEIEIGTQTKSSILKTIAKVENKRKELFYLLEGCNDRNALTPEYLKSLEETQKMLQKLATEEHIIKKEKILEGIYYDYKAKEMAINSSENNDANTKVRVIVDSNEDNGFFVFGKLSFEGNLDIKRFRFNKPTQQATQDFVPGYYLFWLEKEDRIGEPELHLITFSGEDKEKVLVLKAPKK